MGKEEKKEDCLSCCKCVMQLQLWSSHLCPLVPILFSISSFSRWWKCGQEFWSFTSWFYSPGLHQWWRRQHWPQQGHFQTRSNVSPGQCCCQSSGGQCQWHLKQCQWQVVVRKTVATSVRLRESAAQSSCTHSWKPKLNTTKLSHNIDGWLLCARFCPGPEISLESNSVQTLQRSFGWDYKSGSPCVYIYACKKITYAC